MIKGSGRRLATAGLVLTMASAGLVIGGGAGQAAPPPLTSQGYSSTGSKPGCGTPQPGHMTCALVIPTGVTTQASNASVMGYTPADLQRAYNLGTGGGGLTVAIVDAYSIPTLASDLAQYRANFSLPACGSGGGCLQIVNQSGNASPLPGAPPAGTNWGLEASLDVDMVSAACPSCNILIVEANSSGNDDLGAAENQAVALGAVAVSNSFGESESSAETALDASYNHPGVAIVAASGDGGYGLSYPAASQYTTSVGGTTLTRSSSTRGFSETAWSGTGSGCSSYESKPSWQVGRGCANRTGNDVSALADPSTGVSVYDTAAVDGSPGWTVLGGTSAATPIIASAYALAGRPTAGTYPAAAPYVQGSLNDVTTGSNGSCSPNYLCTAGTGYDGPTGLGTPNGTSAFAALSRVFKIAFQANNNNLWTDDSTGYYTTQGLGMAPNTNPAIAVVPGGYETAFQSNANQLWTVDSTGVYTNTGLGMAPGTSPAIASGAAGAYRIAFQATGGQLFTLDNTGYYTTQGLGMAPKTSPAIAVVAGGSYETVFQANTNQLWTVDSAGAYAGTGLGMAPGTSPAIASAGSGAYRIAFQATGGQLFTLDNTGYYTTQSLGMAPNTSPAIAAVAGGYETAFQSNANLLWLVSPSAGYGSTGLGMAAKTSPSMSRLPGGYEIAFVSNASSLWTLDSSGSYRNQQLGMTVGSSPAIGS